MATLSVTITPDSNDGTRAYLSGTFSGGSEDYSYARRLQVTILGDNTYTIDSAQTSGGYNTWSLVITGLDPGVTYAWSADMLYRTTGGWAVSEYRDNGTFTTAPPPAKTYYAYVTFNANGIRSATNKGFWEWFEQQNADMLCVQELKAQAEAKGYHWVDWNVCADDAAGGHPSARTIYENIIGDVGDKTTCVVLMHDTNATRNTTKALPDVIAWFRTHGFQFCTMDDLFAADAAQ